jgi:hypothetical protein
MPRKQHNPLLWFINTGKQFTQRPSGNATATNYQYLR